MKIAAVEVERFRIPAAPKFVWRAGVPGSEPELEGGRLRICTDDGVEGVASTRRGVILEDLVNRRLREELVGEDPFRREWLWHRVWELDRIEEFPLYVLGLVDVALHDLAGKALGVPVYELLGALPDRDSCLCVHGDVLVGRGVPRRRRPVPGAGLPGDKTARLGRCPT